MKPIVVEARAQLPATAARAFDVISTIDLATIMAGSGLLPAVAGVEEQSGAWDSVGESRIVRLVDGTAWIETLTAVEPPRRLAYSMVQLTSVLGLVARSVRGEWRFEQNEAGAGASVVEIRWRCELLGRSWLTRPLLGIVAHWMWRPRMERALTLAGEQVVAGGR